MTASTGSRMQGKGLGEGLGRLGDMKRSLAALEALALGRSVRLADAIAREGGTQQLVYALLVPYRARRDRAEEFGLTPREMDTAARVYDAALYCSIAYVLEFPEWSGTGPEDASKATFASLLNFFKPELFTVTEGDVPPLDDDGGRPGAGALPLAGSRLFSYYDKLVLGAPGAVLEADDERYREKLQLLSRCYVNDRGTAMFAAHSPAAPSSALEALPDEVESMVDAYLCGRGLAPAADPGRHLEAMAAVEHAKRAVWNCLRAGA